MRCVAFRRAAVCLAAYLAGAAVLRVGAARAAECRYGPIYGWNASSLLTDPRTQDAYVSAALEWDGRFAARVRTATCTCTGGPRSGALRPALWRSALVLWHSTARPPPAFLLARQFEHGCGAWVCWPLAVCRGAA